MANTTLYINCTANTEHPWSCITTTPVNIPDHSNNFANSNLLYFLVALACVCSFLHLIGTFLEILQLRRQCNKTRNHGPINNKNQYAIRRFRTLMAISSIYASAAAYTTLFISNLTALAAGNATETAHIALLHLSVSALTVLAAHLVPLVIIAIPDTCLRPSTHNAIAKSVLKPVVSGAYEITGSLIAQAYAAIAVWAEYDTVEKPGVAFNRLASAGLLGCAVLMLWAWGITCFLRDYCDRSAELTGREGTVGSKEAVKVEDDGPRYCDEKAGLLKVIEVV